MKPNFTFGRVCLSLFLKSHYSSTKTQWGVDKELIMKSDHWPTQCQQHLILITDDPFLISRIHYCGSGCLVPTSLSEDGSYGLLLDTRPPAETSEVDENITIRKYKTFPSAPSPGETELKFKWGNNGLGDKGTGKGSLAQTWLIATISHNHGRYQVKCTRRNVYEWIFNIHSFD